MYINIFQPIFNPIYIQSIYLLFLKIVISYVKICSFARTFSPRATVPTINSMKYNILFVYAQYKQKLNQNQKWRIPVTYAHQTQTNKMRICFVTRWKYPSEIHILPVSIQCRLKCILSFVHLPFSYNFYSLTYVLKIVLYHQMVKA